MAFVRKEVCGQLSAWQEDCRKEGCHQLHVSFWTNWHFRVSGKIKLSIASRQEKYLPLSVRATITKCHRWSGGLKNRHLLLTVLETRSPTSKCQHGRLHPEVSFLGLQAATIWLCPHMTSFLCTCRERDL